ncbi:type II toxin-antitoxin system RnlB family antitoxin [Chitinophaga sp. CCNWLW40]|uniref:type II toxin-antitoxin system RnlB family antitoxin n=1 Tax=unclassified Chitinophaga TaxID=2619133 RepID=UPI0038B3FA21
MIKTTDYIILFMSNSNCIIFSLNYKRIESFYGEIESKLRSESFLGTIYFDLLLSNGIGNNRFFKAPFRNNKIEKVSRFQGIEKYSRAIARLNTFLIKNNIDLSKGVLTKSQQLNFVNNLHL